MGSIQSSYCETANKHSINALFPWTTFTVSVTILTLLAITISRSNYKNSFATPFISTSKYLTYATIFYYIIVFSNGIAALITTVINTLKYKRFCRYDTYISATSSIEETPHGGRENRFISLWLTLWPLTMLIILRIMFAIFHKGVNKDLNGEAMIAQPPIQIIQQTPDGQILSSTMQSQPSLPAPDGSKEMNNWKHKRVSMAIFCIILICGLSLMFKPLYLVDNDTNGICKCTDRGFQILVKNVIYVLMIAMFVGIISCITGICCLCCSTQRKRVITGFGFICVIVLYWIIMRVFVNYGRDLYYGVTYFSVIYCIVIVILHIIVCQKEIESVEPEKIDVQIENNETGKMIKGTEMIEGIVVENA